jgi:hypothetical protein
MVQTGFVPEGIEEKIGAALGAADRRVDPFAKTRQAVLRKIGIISSVGLSISV